MILVLRFNSMIVRLKGGGCLHVRTVRFEFQFYDSPIKRHPPASKKTTDPGFNSMIVRLKGYLPEKRQRAFLGFQFYDSPIKSSN